MRRLAHRMGLASWAGPGSADGEAFERLVAPSTHWMAPMRSSTPTGWRPWRPRTNGPRGPQLDEVADTIAARSAGSIAVRPATTPCSTGSWKRGRRSRTRFDSADRARRSADPHRVHVRTWRPSWAGLLVRPRRAPRPARAGSGRGADSADLASAAPWSRRAWRSARSWTRTVLSAVEFDTGAVTYKCRRAGPSPRCCRC